MNYLPDSQEHVAPAGARPARARRQEARRQEARRQEARMQGAGRAPGGEGGQGLLTRATDGELLHPVNFSFVCCEQGKIRSKLRTEDHRILDTRISVRSSSSVTLVLPP